MTGNALVYDLSKAFAIHASAVKVNDGAWVFLGLSGAGKSTICRLLSPYAEPLADDWTYFIFPYSDNRYAVARGDIGNAKKLLSPQDLLDVRPIPLRAIFQLNQAQALFVERLDIPEYCYHLLVAFFGIPFNSNIEIASRKMVFSRVMLIAQAVPGYQLHFPLSADIFSALQSKIPEDL
jgi:hypothetical protein